MKINGINCPIDSSTFNSLVWSYGAMGTSILNNSELTENQKETVIQAWADVAIDVEDDACSEEEIDERIDSYYKSFLKGAA